MRERSGQQRAIALPDPRAGLRRNAPGATVVVGDMASIDVRPGTYDAVAAFYALTHIPRAEHAPLLRRIASWLRPGGLLVATMGAGNHPDAIEDDFPGMGTPVFVGHFDAATNRRLVQEAGLRLLRDDVRVQEEDGRRVAFL